MLSMDYHEMESHDREYSLLCMGFIGCTKPIVGAVNGFCLGGGNEVAMTCDILIASENAKFGQPEISLGIMAGAGGTQRLTAAVGKSLSMQMNLTGEPINAQRALQAGLVSEVVPLADLLPRAQAIAATIATKSLPVIRKIKDAVLSNSEFASLNEAIKYEHQSFVSCWATEDQTEGMTAFSEKRKPEWKHR
jgi:enoyl-CoA hydratase/carnithine racemase